MGGIHLWNTRNFEGFIGDHYIPFIQSNTNSTSLELTSYWKWSDFVIKASYFEPILNILSNLPTSTKKFKFQFPWYQSSNIEQSKIKEIESTKLVKKLCEMVSEKNKTPKLETIIFKNLNLSTKPKNFLLFFFGYNDKVF